MWLSSVATREHLQERTQFKCTFDELVLISILCFFNLFLLYVSDRNMFLFYCTVYIYSHQSLCRLRIYIKGTVRPGMKNQSTRDSIINKS